MNHNPGFLVSLGVVLVTLVLAGLAPHHARPHRTAAPAVTLFDDDVKPVPAFVEQGMAWLAQAQAPNGGWGAGAHAQQDVRNPHAVQTDPATTAFSAMALLRSGSTLAEGPYHTHVRKSLEYLLGLVEAAPEDAVNITDQTGTQPQVKLGQNIDVSMTAQFLTQVLPLIEDDRALHDRVAHALETCVTMLARSQDADGSWNSNGGWAGVLQSAMANNALEMAQAAGVALDEVVVTGLERSRAYQKRNLDEDSGTVRTESAAGISLYSVASNQRATAKEAREAEEAVAQAVAGGRLNQASPAVSEEVLLDLGYEADDAERLAAAYRKNKAAADMVQRDDVLAGFGNNGGEEFLSYMMTSEALVVSGGQAWDGWYQKMHTRLAKIQNPDGSWSGHHCITSPVFCTAAVILAMTADRTALL